MNAKDGVLKVFREAFANPELELTPAMVTGDIRGWDSFKNVEILLACEAEFEIRFRSKEIDRIRSIGDLMDICQDKLSNKNAVKE
jgi:acyl carrier protein